MLTDSVLYLSNLIDGNAVLSGSFNHIYNSLDMGNLLYSGLLTNELYNYVLHSCRRHQVIREVNDFGDGFAIMHNSLEFVTHITNALIQRAPQTREHLINNLNLFLSDVNDVIAREELTSNGLMFLVTINHEILSENYIF